MTENPEENRAVGSEGRCLDIALQPLASSLKASDGREILFTRAMLTIRNVCDHGVSGIRPHATLGQEGGTVQDVTASLAQPFPASISPGQSVTCDVYDLLLPAHPGTASKIHMFGYRAALNWVFDLSVWIEYQASDSAPARTPVSRWAFHWSTSVTDAGMVELGIEDK